MAETIPEVLTDSWLTSETIQIEKVPHCCPGIPMLPLTSYWLYSPPKTTTQLQLSRSNSPTIQAATGTLPPISTGSSSIGYYQKKVVENWSGTIGIFTQRYLNIMQSCISFTNITLIDNFYTLPSVEACQILFQKGRPISACWEKLPIASHTLATADQKERLAQASEALQAPAWAI